MPVIREDRKLGVQPIGVVRASQGGQITADAVAQSAANLGNVLNKKAARYAEKTGTEMAQAASRQDVVGIDPNTGGPIALTQTAKMGTIQSDAYERIVLRRFESSIEEDLSLKSAEIALSNQSEGAYTNIFSQYVAEMSNNATGLYAEYIRNTGEAIQNKTRLTLRENAIRRAQAQASADARASLDRGINYSYSLGMTASQDASSGLGIGQLYQMLNLSEQEISDLNNFTNQDFQFSENQSKLISSYITGRIAGAAFEIPKADVDGLERILRTSPDAPVNLQSREAQAIRDEIRQLTTRGNLANLSDVASGLSTTLTRARASARPSEVSFEVATGDFSNANNRFNQQLSSGYYSNFSLADAQSRLDSIDSMQFNVDVIGANNQNTGLINSRIGYLSTASNELVSNAIVQMALASNYDSADLDALRNQLTVGNIQPLIEKYNAENPNADESIGARIADLFSQVGKDGISSALEVINSQETYLAAQETELVKQADLAMNDSAVAESVARVADNPKLIDSELTKWSEYSNGTNYADVVSQLQNAAKISGVRTSILGLDAPLSPAVLDELRLMAGGIVDPTKVPNLKGLGLYGEVRAMFDGVDQGDRTKIVSGLIDALPNLDQLAAAQYKSNVSDIQAAIRSQSTDYSRMTQEEIMQSGVELSQAIDANTSLSNEDRLSLQLEAAKTVTTELLLKMATSDNQTFVESVSLAIRTGDASKIGGLSAEQQDLVDAYLGNLPESERSDIASTFNAAANQSKEQQRVIREQQDRNNVETAIANNLPLNVLNAEQKTYAANYLRESNGIDQTAIIPDVFRNAQAYVYQAPQEGQPNYGQYYLDAVDAARRGFVVSELSATLSEATIPSALTPLQLSSVVATWDSIANVADPATGNSIRSRIISNSDLSEYQVAILDTMVRARNSGSESLLPDILAYNGRASEIEVAIGMSVDKFVKEAVDSGVGNRDLWANNPSIREPLRLRAQGLFASGRLTERQIRIDLFNYSRNMFVEDDLVVDPVNTSSDLHLISFRQAFGGNDYFLAAATQLTKIDLAYQMGRSIVGPNAPPAEAIAAGYTQIGNKNIQTPYLYGEDFKVGPSPEPLAGYFSDKVLLESGMATKFIPAPSATRSNPVFYLGFVDPNGTTSLAQGVSPINPANPKYTFGANILKMISEGPQTDVSNINRAQDALINLYISYLGLE